MWATQVISQKSMDVCQYKYSRKPYPLGCSDDQELDGALCYPKCPKDKPNGVGPVCYSKCPSSYKDDGLFCRKPAAEGRGAGYTSRSKCKKKHPDSGCDKCGFLFYPKCKEGFKRVGCNLCSPKCPSGMTDIGISCAKASSTRSAGKPVNSCGSKRDEIVALCYDKCRTDYSPSSTKLECQTSCPSTHPVKCKASTFCAKSVLSCGKVIADSAVAVVKLVSNVVEGISTGGASVARNLAINAMKLAVEAGLKETSLLEDARRAVHEAIDEIVKELSKTYRADLRKQLDLAKVTHEDADNAIDAALRSFALVSLESTEYTLEYFVTKLDPLGIKDVIDSFVAVKCRRIPVPEKCSDIEGICGKNGVCASDGSWKCKCPPEMSPNSHGACITNEENHVIFTTHQSDSSTSHASSPDHSNKSFFADSTNLGIVTGTGGAFIFIVTIIIFVAVRFWRRTPFKYTRVAIKSEDTSCIDDSK